MACAGKPTGTKSVLVGISGGVDSAVAALLLAEQGYQVVGVTLRLWSDPTCGDRRAGSSERALERAAKIAGTLGIRHIVVDASDSFRSTVVEYFVREYEQGRTPNPCVKCNARFRFGLLWDIARREGLARVATGHYARLSGDPPALARGVDPKKDQSYVLAEVDPDLLRRCLFPLGAMTKAEVRERAEEAGLSGPSLPESQEICFVPDDDHRRFLRERLGAQPGAVVDASGRVLAQHTGVYNFTVGQRKGLGISADGPLYVLDLRPERREVLVGPADQLAVGAIAISDIVQHRKGPNEGLRVQWRSTGENVPARLIGPDTVVFEQPAVGVSPGQSAVVYQDDLVVSAGTIVSTVPWGSSPPNPYEGQNIPCGIFVRSGAGQKGA